MRVSEYLFSGHIQRGPFEAALEEALGRHPLLRANVGPGKRKLLSWLPARDADPWVDWSSDEQPVVCPEGEAIDLRRQCGLRVFVRQGRDHCRLVFQFHHAATDGAARAAQHPGWLRAGDLRRELLINVRCDPHLFDRAATRRLLTLYTDGIRQWIAGQQ